MDLRIASCTPAQARLLAEFCFIWGCKTLDVHDGGSRQRRVARDLRDLPQGDQVWRSARVFSLEHLDIVARLIVIYFSAVEDGQFAPYMSIHAGRVHTIHNFSFKVSRGCISIAFANIYHAEMLTNLGLDCEVEVTSIDSISLEKKSCFERITSDLCELRWPQEVNPSASCFDFGRWPHPGHCFDRYPLPNAADALVLSWWTRRHDELLRSAIDREGWRMKPPLPELLSITPAEKIAALGIRGDSESSLQTLFFFCQRRARAEESCRGAFPVLAWLKCRICDQYFHQATVARFTPLNLAVVCNVCYRETHPKHEHKWTRAEILDHIRNSFAVSGGRFDMPQSERETLDADQFVELVRLWRFQPPRNVVREMFGSIFAARVEAGVISNEWVRLSRGTRCLARDGHTCLSLGEKVICDWLFENGVPHRREVPYGHGCNYVADWEVGGAIVEYFGYVGDDQYDRKIQKKIEFADNHGLRLIAIYPRDLKQLGVAFGRFGIGPSA